MNQGRPTTTTAAIETFPAKTGGELQQQQHGVLSGGRGKDLTQEAPPPCTAAAAAAPTHQLCVTRQLLAGKLRAVGYRGGGESEGGGGERGEGRRKYGMGSVWHSHNFLRWDKGRKVSLRLAFGLRVVITEHSFKLYV